MKESRLFVTGATGFVGGALAMRLAAEGAEVRALARDPEKAAFLRNYENIEIIIGDLMDQQQMEAATEGCMYVFNVAAALGGPLEHQRKANVAGVRNIMQASARADVRRVIHISTISVYGYKHTGDIVEDITLTPANEPYGKTKSEGEGIVRTIGASQGISYAIIRPGAIYGPRSWAWTGRFFSLARRKPAIFLGKGTGAAPIIYIDDLLDLCIIAAQHPNAHQQAFNAVNDPSPTWRQYLLEYAKLAGHQSYLGIPLWLLKPPMRLVAAFSKPYSLAALFFTILEPLTTYFRYRNTKATQLLDWRPKTSLEAGVQSSIPWLRDRGLID